jgi:hypothetical protein
MHRNNIIILFIIVIILLYLLNNKKENAGNVSQNIPLSNEAIQNIASVYANTAGTSSFNNLNVTGTSSFNNLNVTRSLTTTDINIVNWKGMIVMWSGDVTKIPTGWALCDGTNGTPDLRGRFVLGYNPTQQTDASGNPRKQRDMNTSGGNEQLIANIGFYWWGAGKGTWENGLIYDSMKEGTFNVLTDNTSIGKVMPRVDSEYWRDIPDLSTNTIYTDPKNNLRPVSVTGKYTKESLPPYYVVAYIMKL